MQSTDIILKAVDAFQRGTSGKADMGVALDQMRSAVHADGACLETRARENGTLISMQTAQIDPDSLDLFAGHYGALSPRLAYGLRPDADPICHDSLIGPAAILERHPFYAEFLAQFKLRYFLSLDLDAGEDVLCILSFQFSRQHGDIDREHVRVAGAMRPLLSSSMQRLWHQQLSENMTWVLSDLRRQFHLTPAEGKLAIALAQGLSVVDHAKSQDITANTAYSHYAHLKDKMSIRRQAELVSALRARYPSQAFG